MKELTIEEISYKYNNIEEKIPSIWKTYEDVAISLAQDLVMHWNIKDAEIIRIIAVIGQRTNLKLDKHIDNRFSYFGLYPNIIKSFDIWPDQPIQKS